MVHRSSSKTTTTTCMDPTGVLKISQEYLMAAEPDINKLRYQTHEMPEIISQFSSNPSPV
jgi:hypothetical protein